MNELIYEQPLNEKIRSFLRLEYLAEQLEFNLKHDHQHACFYPLFSLWELCERCDYRNDVIKELDRHLNQLQKWQTLPDADNTNISTLIEQVTEKRHDISQLFRLCEPLKHDRFLIAIRQRFSMPGASCNFDLPQLHFWLSKPWKERKQQYQAWIAHFLPLLDGVKLLLELTRNSTEFEPHTAESGFYQGNGDNLSLVRVRLGANPSSYPTISGNRNRFAIHFMDFRLQKHFDGNVSFELATCR
ncbi:cell division protein ZapD [Parashewanella tropica]|uniref:cell division protein ZapD n=1 Tax=Parashewanella tropica TaxID=2547970 RepID=UPI0010595D40|nr:cell division protein ZapD [Parashewanella tropica]